MKGMIHMKQIFEEVNLKHLHAKNRLVRSATWEGIAKRNGGLTDESYKIYEELAKAVSGQSLPDSRVWI